MIFRRAPHTSRPSSSRDPFTRGRFLLLLSGGLLGLAACDPMRRDTLHNIRAVGAEVLRRDAARFYKNLFVAPSKTSVLLTNEKCPASFQRFQPIRVRAYADGFALCLIESSGREQGLYIVPLQMEAVPQTTASAIFEKLEEGLYWYQFRE